MIEKNLIKIRSETCDWVIMYTNRQIQKHVVGNNVIKSSNSQGILTTGTAIHSRIKYLSLPLNKFKKKLTFPKDQITNAEAVDTVFVQT